MILKDEEKEMQKVIENINTKHADWLRHIVTIAATIFGIMVALHKGHPNNEYLYMYFMISIIILIVGIVSGLIALYGFVDTAKRSRKRYLEYLTEKYIKGNYDYNLVSLKPFEIYNVCGWVCCVAFVLAMIALVLYAGNMDIAAAKVVAV